MAEDWDRRHKRDARNIPSNLYTDDNPSTTIKGTGFKDAATAERTIRLTSQPGVRFNQYWTVRAMRERAAHHPHPTAGIREALRIFDQWLANYRAPDNAERAAQERERIQRVRLCRSVTIRGGDPGEGRRCLLQALDRAWRRKPVKASSQVEFPLGAFVALFGGPGIHGYGKHEIVARGDGAGNVDDSGGGGGGNDGFQSEVTIDGMDGLLELLKGRAPFAVREVTLHYDHRHETARAQIERDGGRAKSLKNFWNAPSARADHAGESWICRTCTFAHDGPREKKFVACEICGSPRCRPEEAAGQTEELSVPQTEGHSVPRTENTSAESGPTPTADVTQVPPGTTSWNLRWTSEHNNHKRRRRALDAPPPTMDHLIVLDFEWTADDRRRMLPVAEITQFPSVALELFNVRSGGAAPDRRGGTHRSLPPDLTDAPPQGASHDARAVSSFDTFVRPTLNPALTEFSVRLTAISQDQVDAATTIGAVVHRYVKWLRSLGLVDSGGSRVGNWSFVTWGDSDIMQTLRLELRHKSIPLPPCFDRWINLKSPGVFRRHYNREPKGGLRSCVESVGAKWEGRAHNGFVDSVNTAKIVRHMVQTGYLFTRPTRGLDKCGVPFGQKE
eukprot:CAMPEP_0194294480 /NCGR_PEP_ID=MMETSP0169-20130528/50755_1 /TAXON_ID=218684 /ORGANISM="Corethron pennatum, Strain L29A3" /LENGTH=616 /DNA_ID=CAMNT_0039043343 /DNA_START=134 /DNA_END=1984 /DNA_ORIENTATION=-